MNCYNILPLVYGQTIHYVLNGNYTEDALISLNYECEYHFGRDILSLTGLTRELLARNIIPFYSASITNIGLQMVARR